MKMLDNPYYCKKVMQSLEKELVGESSTSMSKLFISETENMGGNSFASHATEVENTGIASASYVNDNKTE